MSLAVSKPILENSLKFKTEVISSKSAGKLTTGFGSRLLCCKLYLQVANHYQALQFYFNKLNNAVFRSG